MDLDFADNLLGQKQLNPMKDFAWSSDCDNVKQTHGNDTDLIIEAGYVLFLRFCETSEDSPEAG
jgi:hypothetical protein